ncbi:MAG: hypothetical protein CVV44_07095 [Spirochaetae bacterium HGW-Spirochaetae-1]|jgi:ankyrin repeat protein|nr:MAG: hypothetical protein CVV44_07095 [Spirochaetae bacterium HGW-Spirochaetae-1]
MKNKIITTLILLIIIAFSGCKTVSLDDPGNRNLTYAVLSGDVEMARQSLIEGADTRARGSDGKTFLHLAAIGGKTDMTEFLIKIGCDLNARDINMNTPLHYAIINNRFDAAKVLISRGADVNARNSKGKTPLHLAVVSLPNISEDTPSAMPNEGEITSTFGVRQSPFRTEYEFHSGLDIATLEGKPIKATANGIVVKSCWMGGYGNTVILRHKFGFDTMYGHCRELRVTRGAKVKKGDIIATVGMTGNTTGSHCHYEIRFNDIPVNPYPYLHNVKMKTGSVSDIYSMTRMLLEKNAIVNSRDDEGVTPLHDVVTRDLETARLLILIGADVNARDKKGRTPLHHAASGNYKIAAFLLEKGADPMAKTTAEYSVINGQLFLEGSTPMDVAARFGAGDIIALLAKSRVKK